MWVSAYGSGAFVLEATLAEALPGPWAIPEEEPCSPSSASTTGGWWRSGNCRTAFSRARFFSDGALGAVREFYSTARPIRTPS